MLNNSRDDTGKHEESNYNIIKNKVCVPRLISILLKNIYSWGLYVSHLWFSTTASMTLWSTCTRLEYGSRLGGKLWPCIAVCGVPLYVWGAPGKNYVCSCLLLQVLTHGPTVCSSFDYLNPVLSEPRFCVSSLTCQGVSQQQDPLHGHVKRK